MKFNLLTLFIALLLLSSYKYKPTEKYDYLVTISTNFGNMKLLLYDDTPIHKKNFLDNIKKGYYENSKFHRVINNFMIQGGEPVKKIFEDTAGLITRTIPAEIHKNRTHVFGALAAARTENPEMRSDKTQFYIVQNHNGAHHLDNGYTVFGRVVAGFDIIDKIAQVPVNGSSPKTDVLMHISVEKIKVKDKIKYYGRDY